MKITFVCLGNICRSPMAEFICKDILINKFDNNSIKVVSAGTSGYHDGEYMHKETAKMLDKNNINNKPFVSKKITRELIDSSDYIFVMDKSNYDDVLKFGADNKKLILITDYMKSKKINGVPDPWFTNNFDETYSILSECINNFLNELFEEEIDSIFKDFENRI